MHRTQPDMHVRGIKFLCVRRRENRCKRSSGPGFSFLYDHSRPRGVNSPALKQPFFGPLCAQLLPFAPHLQSTHDTTDPDRSRNPSSEFYLWATRILEIQKISEYGI